MTPRVRSLLTPIAATSVLCLGARCGDEPLSSDTPPACIPDASTIFLQSQVDDDDRDGNPVDEDFPRINDEDDDIADHAWCRDDAGMYHLFFQNEGHGGGSDLEHYVSKDLRSLDRVGVALRKNPDGWDSFALWAPHIVRSGGTWFMFYTGTTGVGPAGVQRIGLATSTDLVHWTRWPGNRCPGTTGDGCIYECAECWTTWSRPPGSYDKQCRDPFVDWDAAAGRWLLFATAKSTNGFGVVTVAQSPDLVRWTGAGFIDATRRLPDGSGAQTSGGQAENAFVMSRAGVHYLLFTDWQDAEDACTVLNPRTIVQFATSTSLAVDSLGSAAWVYGGSIADPGVNAIEVQVVDGRTWVMSESVSNERCVDYPVHRRHLRLRRVVWQQGLGFDTETWRPDRR